MRRCAVYQVWVAAAARAQSDDLRPVIQPTEKTKAAFLARARALRDQAVREGDQAYGAVVVCDGSIGGEGRNYVVLHHHPTARAELCGPRRRTPTQEARSFRRDVYSTVMPSPMCQGALYWARIHRYHNESTPEGALLPSLHVEEAEGAKRHTSRKPNGQGSQEAS
jgi:tRNA(Arg) A34 adenosine deaminase TadA